jgi:hypothetical protein
MSEPHYCNGCGRTGRLSDGVVWNRDPDAEARMPPLLTRSPAGIWPDERERLLCPKCGGKLAKRLKRLAKVNTDLGCLT